MRRPLGSDHTNVLSSNSKDFSCVAKVGPRRFRCDLDVRFGLGRPVR
jgi:hypothetical protein